LLTGFASSSGGPDFHQSAITPPSSVSPRDGAAGGSSLTAEAMAAAIRTQQYLSQTQVRNLSINPKYSPNLHDFSNYFINIYRACRSNHKPTWHTLLHQVWSIIWKLDTRYEIYEPQYYN
jgi:hypothetical protein